MMASDIHLVGLDLTAVEVDDIIDSLERNSVRILCLRNCTLGDHEFFELMRAVGQCESILQINCALGVINSISRMEALSQAIAINFSLRDIFLHSNPLKAEGVTMICDALFNHPRLASLDVGDCEVDDVGLEAICTLLPSKGRKLGLQELVLSGNGKVTSMGWAKLAISLAFSSSLRSLHLDFNNLGDYATSCILISLAANSRIEHVDLEATSLTQHSADLLLYLVRNYPLCLKKIILAGNDVHPSTLESIRICLQDAHPSDLKDSLSTNKNNSASSKTLTNASRGDKKLKALRNLGDMMARDLDIKIRKEVSSEEEPVYETVIVKEVHDRSRSLSSTKNKSLVNAEKNNEKFKMSKEMYNKKLGTAKSNKRVQKLKAPRSRELGVVPVSVRDGNVSSTDEYEEMKEVPINEIQQPIITPWINLSRIIVP